MTFKIDYYTILRIEERNQKKELSRDKLEDVFEFVCDYEEKKIFRKRK